MKVISSPTVDSALAMGVHTLLREGVQEDSRNGPVWVMPEPVSNVYQHPRLLVLFNEFRDANPFFHLYEALWMLAGRNDLAPLARLASNMSNFSVDGKTFNAAYGHRWRNNGLDQLREVIEKLKKTPNTRQAVINIWDQDDDLVDGEHNARDRACNLSMVFTPRVRDGKKVLDMMVSNRSNDAVWGAYGANYVHFSMVLIFVAEASGFDVGQYTQVSANFHMYGEGLYGKKLFNNLVQEHGDHHHVNGQTFAAIVDQENNSLLGVAQDAYLFQGKMFLEKMFDFSNGVDQTLREIEEFAIGGLPGEYFDSLAADAAHADAAAFHDPKYIYSSPILHVAHHMMVAWSLRKSGHPDRALKHLRDFDTDLQASAKNESTCQSECEGCECPYTYVLGNVEIDLSGTAKEMISADVLPSLPHSDCGLDWYHAASTWIHRRMPI